jgi:hypothetical protein
MCFSATASFIAGAGLSTVGVATIKKTKEKSEIPFAAIPLLFGIQQAIEGVVWLSFSYHAPLIHALATYGFAFFAYAFWPMFIPFAVRHLEKEVWRKKVLSLFQIIGLAVGIYITYYMLSSGVTSAVTHESITYNFDQPFGNYAFVLYIIAGCGSFFVSSKKNINFLGLLLVISLMMAYFFFSTYVVSTWCFFAAILSIIIYFHFTANKKIH